MRLALKTLGMAKNEILSHAMRDVEISMSASAKLFITFSFLSFFNILDGFLGNLNSRRSIWWALNARREVDYPMTNAPDCTRSQLGSQLLKL